MDSDSDALHMPAELVQYSIASAGNIDLNATLQWLASPLNIIAKLASSSSVSAGNAMTTREHKIDPLIR